MNKTVTKAEARQNFDKVWTTAMRSKSPVIITSGRNASAVLVSLDEWNGMAETNYVLSPPQNAKRLAKAIRDMNAGTYVAFDPTAKSAKPPQRFVRGKAVKRGK